MQNKPFRSQYMFDGSSDACVDHALVCNIFYICFHLFQGLSSTEHESSLTVRWNKATVSEMHSQGKTLVLRAIFMIIYGFVGAAIFTLVEKREESNKTTSNRLLKDLRKNFTKHQNISDEEFQILTMAVYKAVRVGLSADWTYFRAVDFTYTALTTIG